MTFDCIMTGEPVATCDGCEYQDVCAGVGVAEEEDA